MLVEFQVANFGSFKDPASLNMQSSREQRFRDRVPRLEQTYRMSVNPIAAIYGANASGKSNLLQALRMLRSMVLGTRSVDRQRDYLFMLDPNMLDEPTLFKLVFTVNDTMYSYFLAIRHGHVLEEYLAKLTATQETIFFDRQENKVNFGSPWQDNPLINELATTVQKDVTLAGRLANVLKGNEQYSELLCVYSFLKKIILITPRQEKIIIPEFHRDFELDAALSALDTGVTHLDFTTIEEGQWPFEKGEISEHLPEEASIESSVSFFQTKDGRLYRVSRDEENITVSHIRFCHQGQNGSQHLLDWRQESQGTRKILALLPWMWFAANMSDPPILLVDELDHSLHTQLTKALIESYLSSCDNTTRAQLIFTAHDLLLMDLDYLRRDEIWITDKNKCGQSTLIGLPEYKGIRADKDIIKSYLQGRFGGVPQLGKFTLKEVDND